MKSHLNWSTQLYRNVKLQVTATAGMTLTLSLPGGWTCLFESGVGEHLLTEFRSEGLWIWACCDSCECERTNCFLRGVKCSWLGQGRFGCRWGAQMGCCCWWFGIRVEDRLQGHDTDDLYRSFCETPRMSCNAISIMDSLCLLDAWSERENEDPDLALHLAGWSWRTPKCPGSAPDNSSVQSERLTDKTTPLRVLCGWGIMFHFEGWSVRVCR